MTHPFRIEDARRIIARYKIDPTGVTNELYDIVFGDTDFEPVQLNDLITELYLFTSDGDLRKQGRDFGYASIDEIEAELNAIADKASQPALS